jgi:16S rRNA (guanine966-N2)-methyltransferase
LRIIAGKYKSRKIHSVLAAKDKISPGKFSKPGSSSNLKLRPTTDRARESLFNILNNIVDFEGLKCLDLFAGTGAVGFELLSRGAANISFIESSSEQAKLIRKTAMELGCDSQIEIFNEDAEDFLLRHKGEFYDFVFSDPPYGYGDNQRWLNLLSAFKFNIFVFEHGSAEKPDFTFEGFSLIERKTGITNFKIFISEN